MRRQPPLNSIPANLVSAGDYATRAREHLDATTWAWLSGGAGDEHTLRDNESTWSRLRLRNRVLADLRDGHTRVELFGATLPFPVLLAPVAYQRLAHDDGERASAAAAAAMGTAMVVSTQASQRLEDIAAVAPGAPRWFQLYIQPDREFTLALVRRAEAAGYQALVVTVDAPVSGLRDRERRAGFVLPPDIAAVNLEGMRQLPPHNAKAGDNPLFGSPLLAAAPTWADIAWLRGQTRLPVLVKGILTGHDAEAALAHGADGVIVSNHGGRVLDTVPASADALPEVVTAVAGRVPVLVDGGIRRGSDVLKALALGAQAVLVGRPAVQALAVAGAPGVAHVLHLLRGELEMAMALTGCRTLADIGPQVLWRGFP